MQEAFRAWQSLAGREIMRLLGNRELPAGEIATHFNVSRPAISQHLQVLKVAGLVEERREGTRRLYHVRPEGLQELRSFLESFWDDALARLAEAAEAEQRKVDNDQSGNN